MHSKNHPKFSLVSELFKMAPTIKEFYKNSHIFITGGTGFVGIALLEKFLRDVPFEKIYLLLRPKKGMSVDERLKQVLDNKVSGFLF
jgi:Putative dehydrogenase domain of multifunctional non-ribosomal peptide synthetases and related enzymes